MKRANPKRAIETHNISQKRYPMPGTDLGSTNAIPFNQAEDVDASGGAMMRDLCDCGHYGRHYDWEDHSAHIGSQTFVEARPRRDLIYPASNPTRAKK